MKQNEILKQLIDVKDSEEVDFDDTIFEGTNTFEKENAGFLQNDSDNEDIVERGQFRVNSAFVNEELGEAYEGKPVSRQKISKNYSNSIDFADASIESEDDSQSDDDSNSAYNGSDVNLGEFDDTNEDFNESKDDYEENEDEDDVETSERVGSDASSIEDDLDDDNEDDGRKRKSLNKNLDIFSKGGKSVADDKKKGSAILRQQELWETLLESRIKLQKCLVASNKLPLFSEYSEFQNEGENDFTNKMNKCCNGLYQVLEKLLKFQDTLLDASPEYCKTRKSKGNTANNSDKLTEVPLKKRKLSVYEDILHQHHQNFEKYRNNEIQMWNDKTKISSGKFSSSNFSAFDLPTLKQIEQILSDKPRLIKRTQTKRSQYSIYTLKPKSQEEENEETNPEIFDDDDFYHKLLRDLIERKSVDVTDPSRLGKQWVQLQKLRSKMKKKVDTRASKGRKLRFTVHSKLVNFMAPIESVEINEDAVKQLYTSLFGKFKS